MAVLGIILKIILDELYESYSDHFLSHSTSNPLAYPVFKVYLVYVQILLTTFIAAILVCHLLSPGLIQPPPNSFYPCLARAEGGNFLLQRARCKYVRLCGPMACV